MNVDDYQQEAMSLLNPALNPQDVLENALMGLCGESGEAIDLLKEGIGKVPPTQNRHRVVESAILISAAMRRGKWIDTLMAATGEQQLSPHERLFAEVIRIQVDGDWNAAAEKASFIDIILRKCLIFKKT